VEQQAQSKPTEKFAERRMSEVVEKSLEVVNDVLAMAIEEVENVERTGCVSAGLGRVGGEIEGQRAGNELASQRTGSEMASVEMNGEMEIGQRTGHEKAGSMNVERTGNVLAGFEGGGGEFGSQRTGSELASKRTGDDLASVEKNGGMEVDRRTGSWAEDEQRIEREKAGSMSAKKAKVEEERRITEDDLEDGEEDFPFLDQELEGGGTVYGDSGSEEGAGEDGEDGKDGEDLFELEEIPEVPPVKVVEPDMFYCYEGEVVQAGWSRPQGKRQIFDHQQREAEVMENELCHKVPEMGDVVEVLHEGRKREGWVLEVGRKRMIVKFRVDQVGVAVEMANMLSTVAVVHGGRDGGGEGRIGRAVRYGDESRASMAALISGFIMSTEGGEELEDVVRKVTNLAFTEVCEMYGGSSAGGPMVDVCTAGS
jgi:hypothetical protein